jgi:hypothetical protein
MHEPKCSGFFGYTASELAVFNETIVDAKTIGMALERIESCKNQRGGWVLTAGAQILWRMILSHECVGRYPTSS